MPKVGVEFLAECIKAEAVVVTQQQSRPRIPKRCVFYQFGICSPNTLVSRPSAEIDDSQVNGILMSKVRYNKTAELLGPKAALKHAGLDGLTENDRLQWLEDARVHAILDCSLFVVKGLVEEWFSLLQSLCDSGRSIKRQLFTSQVGHHTLLVHYLPFHRHIFKLYCLCSYRVPLM